MLRNTILSLRPVHFAKAKEQSDVAILTAVYHSVVHVWSLYLIISNARLLQTFYTFFSSITQGVNSL